MSSKYLSEIELIFTISILNCNNQTINLSLDRENFIARSNKHVVSRITFHSRSKGKLILSAYFIYWCAFTILVFESSSSIFAWIRLFTCMISKKIWQGKGFCNPCRNVTYTKDTLHSSLGCNFLSTNCHQIHCQNLGAILNHPRDLCNNSWIGAIFFHVVRSCGQALHLLAQNLCHNRGNDFLCFGWC